MTRLNVASDPLHRMAMDMSALAYSDGLVRSGGAFQVVSRGITNHFPTFLDDVTQGMQALAEHGRVDLIDVTLVRYDEPTTTNRIGLGAPGLSAGDADTFAASAIFRVR
jgi:hypothetical protein